ncbi:MAG TPA: hypothetical protein VJ976_10250 [Ornithinimicrobium sp.]|uniref:sodium:solute symporter family transporter n=1 Tax=Ornithinimicrobium sp. TaxID=1977084 RepID=UPI002B4824F7|nr:hypothetical protein [Ornithinimicrobium sp.]HKJ12752.1 hypothetical protein [Ornithinimicrobium sp.]
MSEDAFLDPLVGAAIMVVFSLLWIGLGVHWGRTNSEGTKGYLFAGRNVGLALVTATLMATWVTGNTVLAAPEQAYKIGVWGVIGYCFAGFGLLAFAPLALRIRRLMPNGFTSGDFMRLRYGRGAWVPFMAISVFYFLAFLITLGMGAGLLVEALTGLDYHVGLLTVMIVTTIYTLLGGMRGVIGMDFIQAMIILGLLIVVAFMALTTYSPAEIQAGVIENKPGHLDLLLPAGLLYAWNTGLFSMGEVFHSNIWWMRAYSSRPSVNLKGFIVSGVAWMTVPLVAGVVTLVAIAFPGDFDIPQVNMVLPVVASTLLGPLGAALIFIVVFAALASTGSGLLTATATLLAQDFYRPFVNPEADDETMKQTVRRLIAVLCVLTIALAWVYVTSMYGLLLFAGALVGSTVWPVLCGLYWDKTNPVAASAGMVLGSASGLVFYFAVSSFGAALTGFVVSALVTVLGSRAKPQDFDWKILAYAGHERTSAMKEG